MNIFSSRGTGRESTLEERVVERVVEKVNLSLIERKSSEILEGNGEMPLTLTPEVRDSAIRSMEYNRVAVPQESLKKFRNSESIDLRKIDETTGWNLFWAQEMEAAKIAIAHGGGRYQEYLPGRFLHYDILAHQIASLFNGGGNGVKGKKILELGSGSGLGLMRLAQEGAIVTGLDSSVMANDFARYLSNHYRVEADIREGDYLSTSTGLDDNTFDTSYTSGVFEHLTPQGQSALLKEMYRVTKPGGYVVITIPNEGSRFYGKFKQREEAIRRKFPGLVGIPVEHKRDKSIDPEELLRQESLHYMKKDGILVAPSANIRGKDIIEKDLDFFDIYLPKNVPQDAENKVANWRGLELRADPNLRISYGWSLLYVAQKQLPVENTELQLTEIGKTA